MGLALLGLLAPLLLGIRMPGEPAGVPLPDNWFFNMERLVRARAEKIAEPKVIFVSGSSLLFGIRAESLGRRIGRPVVNYGLIAPLGFDLIAERAGEIVRPGDWVVLGPEADHFNASPTNTWRTAWLEARTPMGDRPGWKGLWSRERARRRCAIVPTWLAFPAEWSSAEHWPKSRKSSSPYEAAAFGPDGELIHERPGPASAVLHSPPSATAAFDFQTSWGARGFEHLRDVCARQKATLAVMPAIRVADPKNDHALVEGFERLWVAFAVGRGAVVLLGPGESALHGNKYAYDTEWHLNDVGVLLMEERLAAALLKLFGDPPPPPSATGKRP